MGIKTIQFRTFTTPDGKPTCKTKEGQCFFLDVSMRGDRLCDCAKRLSFDAAKLDFYNDDETGYLVPHRWCIMTEQKVL